MSTSYLGILVSALALAGCINEPVATARSTNPRVAVDLLFEHEGCRVYRFEDNGFRYYVRCAGTGEASTGWQESCGKHCTRSMEVPTLPLPSGSAPPPSGSTPVPSPR